MTTDHLRILIEQMPTATVKQAAHLHRLNAQLDRQVADHELIRAINTVNEIIAYIEKETK